MPAYDAQEAIRQKRGVIEREIADAQEALDIAVGKSRANRKRCTHPSAYSVSHMGEKSMYCPDCGDDA